MERNKGKQTRVMLNGDIRQYDYKTIIVDGGLHHILKQNAKEMGMSINKYIGHIVKTQQPNVIIENLEPMLIGKKEL